MERDHGALLRRDGHDDSRPRRRSEPGGTGCSSAWRRSPGRPPTTTTPPGAGSGAGERRPASFLRRPTTPSEEGETTERSDDHRDQDDREDVARSASTRMAGRGARHERTGACLDDPWRCRRLLRSIPGAGVVVDVVAPGAAVVVETPDFDRVPAAMVGVAWPGGARAGPARCRRRGRRRRAWPRCGGRRRLRRTAIGPAAPRSTHCRSARRRGRPPAAGRWNWPVGRSGTSNPRHRWPGLDTDCSAGPLLA